MTCMSFYVVCVCALCLSFFHIIPPLHHICNTTTPKQIQQSTWAREKALQYVAVCCSMLQCLAVCWHQFPEGGREGEHRRQRDKRGKAPERTGRTESVERNKRTAKVEAKKRAENSAGRQDICVCIYVYVYENIYIYIYIYIYDICMYRERERRTKTCLAELWGGFG